MIPVSLPTLVFVISWASLLHNAIVTVTCVLQVYENRWLVIAEKVFIRGWYVFLDKRLKVIYYLWESDLQTRNNSTNHQLREHYEVNNTRTCRAARLARVRFLRTTVSKKPFKVLTVIS